MTKLPDKRCENCRWFATWAQERMVGLCGHPSTTGECVVKTETCERHEGKE